jgi:hypothetical protein
MVLIVQANEIKAQDREIDGHDGGREVERRKTQPKWRTAWLSRGYRRTLARPCLRLRCDHPCGGFASLLLHLGIF